MAARMIRGKATKTTFYLEDALRVRLKELAARSGKTVTDLLTRGAELVLEAEQRVADHEELERRGRQAWERLRQGLYDGPGISDRVDEIVYGPRRTGPRPSGARARRSRG